MKKILTYALILAAASFSGAVFAQNAAPAQQQASALEGLKVATSVNDGVVTITMEGNVESAMTSAEDEFKKMLEEAIKASGPKTNIAKAVEAAMMSIRAHIADANAPVKGPVALTAIVKPNLENATMQVDVEMAMGGVKFESATNSTFNPDGSLTTTANVTRTDAAGQTMTAGTVVTTSAAGKISVTGGSQTIVAESTATTASQNVTSDATVPNETGGGSSSTGNVSDVVPDNSIVTSGDE